MRLIDKDKVINVIDTYDNTDYSLEEVTSITDGIHTEIEKIETIDAMPVMHGHWISEADKYSLVNHSYHPYICSECNTVYWVYQPNGELIGMEFCSHCGVKMDEKKGEQDETD